MNTDEGADCLTLAYTQRVSEFISYPCLYLSIRGFFKLHRSRQIA